MAELLKKFSSQDAIAVVIIVGCFIGKFLGLDGTVSTILMTVVVFYFGKKEIVDKIKKTTKEISLRELAEAMAHFEGFYCKDKITLAQKNNNPLNLRPSPYYSKKGWVDVKNNFIKFPTIKDGWAGCLWDLKFKCTDSKALGPEATIQDLIFIWTATDKDEYLKFVCDRLKISKHFKLKEFEM